VTTRLVVVASAWLLGCGVAPPARPPSSVQRVAVLAPSNRTGDGLLVAGTSLLEKYALRTDRVTVPDVLGAELRTQLVRRGFAVVPPEVVQSATAGRAAGSPEAAAEMARNGHLDAPVLMVVIDRWEPDAETHPAFVIVALDAALVDPSNGAVLWHAHRTASPIATAGTVNLGSAYEIAARKAAEELVGSWGPERPPES
jgi:hypothetical protein